MQGAIEKPVNLANRSKTRLQSYRPRVREPNQSQRTGPIEHFEELVEHPKLVLTASRVHFGLSALHGFLFGFNSVHADTTTRNMQNLELAKKIRVICAQSLRKDRLTETALGMLKTDSESIDS